MVFIFVVLVISISELGSVATASGNINNMADLPIGKSTKEPMGKFSISSGTPKPTNKSFNTPKPVPSKPEPTKPETSGKTRQQDKMPKPEPTKSAPPAGTRQSDKTPKREPSNKTPKAKQPNKPSETVYPSKTHETITPNVSSKHVSRQRIYLSDYFLHLSVGETFITGISFISQKDAINKNANTAINKNVGIKIINCNKIKGNTDNIDENKNIKNNKNKINNKMTEKEILSVGDNCIKAENVGLAVVVFYLKSNPDIKTSCTVRVTEQ